jgi:glycosyltransferase involved in cell wall biosynthesis
MASMKPELRVALVNRLDAEDVRVLSGATHFMMKALERRSVSVTSLGPMVSVWMKLGRYVSGASRLVGRRYDWTHSLVGSRELAKKFAARLDRESYDVIFAPLASAEIAYLKTSVPIVYLTDMTYSTGKSYYHSFSNLLPFAAVEGEAIERRAIRKASEVVTCSEWVARSFREDYGCAPAHVHVVPYGANLDSPPTREEALVERDREPCRLLMLGVDWDRKGGPLALQVLQSLLEAGAKAELIVCGCKPPTGVTHPFMRVIPFLNKSCPDQARQLRDLLLSSTFLILPSQAEAWGFVFAEASACGLPSITRNTGGIASVVRHGINGLCLPAQAEAGEYSALVLELLRSPEHYRSLCASSRDEYEKRLNWDLWAARMVEVFTLARDSAIRSAGTPYHS